MNQLSKFNYKDILLLNKENYTINFHYLKRYFKFIDYYKYSPNLEKNNLHKHHILPRSLFKEYECFYQYPENCLLLTFKQHKVAHSILALAFPKSNLRCALSYFNEDKIQGTKWFNDGVNNFRLPKSLNENLKPGRASTDIWKNRTYVNKDGKNKTIHISDLERYLQKGYKKGLIKKYKIKVLTNGIQNIGMAQDKVETFLLEHPNYRIGFTLKSERRKNTFIYHKGNQECRVLEREIKLFEDNGWVKGRCEQNVKKFRNCCTQIHKDGIGRRVSKKELTTFLDNGWQLGLPANSNHNKFFKNCVGINKDGVIKKIQKEDLDKYLKAGWTRGYLKKTKPEMPQLCS